MDSWIEQEMAGCQLKDKRLRERLKKVLERLSNDPYESIPAANDSWGETIAAYRFLDNRKVDFERILEGHRQASIKRISKHSMVFLAQDTSFLNFAQEQALGLGTLRKTENEYYLLHPTVAFSADRVNLGVLDADFWQRPEESENHLRTKKPIEEKESYRWIKSDDMACRVQKDCPKTMVVSLADREGDRHEWFVEAENRPVAERAEYIIRAKCNRRTQSEDDEISYLWDELTASPVLGKLSFVTPRNKNRQPRKVTLVIRAKQVEFTGRKGRKTQPVTVYAVLAKEPNPPKGEKPITWMLLTSIPAEDLAMAKNIVAWYRNRWEIEIYFRILKHGCTVEDLRLETDRRLLNAIAVHMIVAWRIHTITMASRSYPNKSCNILFADPEWQTIYLMRMKKKPPKTPPKLNEITRMLAQLGGFLARKHDGEPGVQTIWRGYRRLKEYVEAIQMAQQLLTT